MSDEQDTATVRAGHTGHGRVLHVSGRCRGMRTRTRGGGVAGEGGGSMTQLALLLGRPLRMPADDDGSYDHEAVTFTTVDVYLSPRQATLDGRRPRRDMSGLLPVRGRLRAARRTSGLRQ